MELKAIETAEQVKKRQRKNKIILSIFLIVLMVGSTAGYAISLISGDSSGSSSNTRSEQAYFNNGVWVVERDGRTFGLVTPPEESRDIPIDVSVSRSTFAGQNVYIVSESEVIEQELSQVIGAYAARLQRACYGPCDEPELPEKNCSDYLIIWSLSDEKRVYQKEKCIFIEGDISAADALLYRILDV